MFSSVGGRWGRVRTAPVGRGKKAGKGPRLRFSTELGRRGRGLTARTPPRRVCIGMPDDDANLSGEAAQPWEGPLLT